MKFDYYYTTGSPSKFIDGIGMMVSPVPHCSADENGACQAKSIEEAEDRVRVSGDVYEFKVYKADAMKKKTDKLYVVFTQNSEKMQFSNKTGLKSLQDDVIKYGYRCAVFKDGEKMAFAELNKLVGAPKKAKA